MSFITGKIYKIQCNVTGKIYIGSTTKSLEQRLSQHLAPSNKCMSKEVTASGNFKIELIEEYECNTRDQLRMREEYWMLSYDCVNIRRAFTTPEQRAEQNRENVRKWQKEHPVQQRECLLNWQKVRITCECGAQICQGAKFKHLQSKRHLENLSAKNIQQNATVEKTETTHIA